jgi:hypothetical protein
LARRKELLHSNESDSSNDEPEVFKIDTNSENFKTPTLTIEKPRKKTTQNFNHYGNTT